MVGPVQSIVEIRNQTSGHSTRRLWTEGPKNTPKSFYRVTNCIYLNNHSYRRKGTNRSVRKRVEGKYPALGHTTKGPSFTTRAGKVLGPVYRPDTSGEAPIH